MLYNNKLVFMKHFYNNGKEYLKATENQGRSESQMAGSYMGAFIGFVGTIAILLYLIITN